MIQKDDEGIVHEECPLHLWFELSYAQFLTIPRLVMQEMPFSWRQDMARLLNQLDARIDWRPKEGRYWVRLKDDRGRFSPAPLADYRRGHVPDELWRTSDDRSE